MNFASARSARRSIPGSAFKHGKDIKAQAPQKVIQPSEVDEDEATQPQCEELDSDESDCSEDSADDEAAFREHCKDMFEKFDPATVSSWLDLEKKRFLKKQPPLKKQKK